METKLSVKLVAVACAMFASSVALANPTSVTLGNGWGNLAGEFKAKVTGGTFTPFQTNPGVLYGTGTSFITFCLEKNEYFQNYDTQNLYVKGAPNSGAIKGGVGRAKMYAGDVPLTPIANFDPISKATQLLYYRFSDGDLAGYNYSNTAARAASADSLQNAIWYLENELGNEPAVGPSLLSSLSAQTQAWVSDAISDVTNNTYDDDAEKNGLWRVQVLNLYTDPGFQNISQDQLYMVPIPEPETYAMMLAGLGLIGFVARRRRRTI